MEKILSSPGLQHIAENIFFNLDVEHLQICGILNGYSKQILDSRMFQDAMYWVRKYEGLSLENQNDWINVIPLVHASYKRKYAIISYLRWNLKNGSVDLLSHYESDVRLLDLVFLHGAAYPGNNCTGGEVHLDN